MSLSKEHREWLALTLIPGVGTTHFIRLLARFREPAAVLSASEAALREVVGPKLAQRITQYRDVVDLEYQQNEMAQYGAQVITLNDTEYPPRLGEIYDPPLVLFVRGELLTRDEHCVAIVGTRRATPYGIRMAEKLGRELGARGVTVVSGMASGIDSAAHRGALEAGGRTIAVLGCGVDVVYPPENSDLMHQIIHHGCVLSQFAMGAKPSKGHFPYRNRIISGISAGTVVVQAPLKSGALITAHTAVEQGREVFAVPGEVGALNSQGPHSLLRDGAKIAETVEDILLELNFPDNLAVHPQPAVAGSSVGSEAPRTPEKTEKAQSGIEEDILSVLSRDGSFVDEIAAASRVSISEALSALTMLELKGLIRQFSGKRFAPR